MLAARISMLLAAMAAASCSRGTTCGSKLCSAGPENAREQRNNTSTAYMPVTPATPAVVRPESHHSAPLHTAPTAQLLARMALRLKRSIKSPAGSSRHSMGKNCANPTYASARGSRVRSYTCQATTTACICVANTAMSRALMNARKPGWR